MEEMERDYAQRAAVLEQQLAERQQLDAKLNLSAAASEAEATLQRQSTSKLLEGLKKLDTVKEEEGGVATATLRPSTAQRHSRAVEQARAASEVRKVEAASGGKEAVKALREAEKKNRQLEATAQKLRQQVGELELKLEKASKAKSDGSGGHGGAGAAAGGAAKGGNPAKLAKDLENSKKREDKYKAELQAANEKVGKLEKDLKEVSKSKEEVDKEMKALEGAAAQLQGLKDKVKEAEEKAAEMDAAYAEVEASYKKEMQLRKKYYNQIEDMKGKIRVYARCRPFAGYEKDKGCKLCIDFKDDTTCRIDVGNRADGRPKDRPEFMFDEIFRPESTQEQIFDGVSHLVQSALDGYNVCIFAYGQTGSGKTFTMYGKRDDDRLQGIAPRAMRELYQVIEAQSNEYEVKVTCYMLELYNDQLVDLLVSKKERDAQGKLDIKLDKRGVVVVQNAYVTGACKSFKELYEWNEKGMNQRHVAATAMNQESSRSHLVFSILIESKNKTTGAVSLGKLTLVDLAGSERQSKTQATGERLKEAKSINMSLSALGDVISALSTGEKFVPYRNNLLTKLLQDGLGGNAKTLMFVNISPADYNMEETVTSLQVIPLLLLGSLQPPLSLYHPRTRDTSSIPLSSPCVLATSSIPLSSTNQDTLTDHSSILKLGT